MFFRIGNVDKEAFKEFYGNDTICDERTSTLIDSWNRENMTLPRRKIWIFDSPREREMLVNATRLTGRDGRELNVINPEDFTEAEIFGRQHVREYWKFLRSMIPSCENSYVVDTGVDAGISQTRSIQGMETLTNQDVVNCRKRPDGIVKSSWPIELHSGDKPKLHWLDDDYYEVPYHALVPQIGENIIVAGRCLSAEHEALASA